MPRSISRSRRLSDACLSRALNGEVVPHFYQGEQVGEHRRYDNKLAMFLLRYRDPLRYAATLDQMVYSGHPEAAALAFGKARDRAADEAHGLAEPAVATGLASWDVTPIAQARAAAAEEALIDGDGKVHGSFERRERIYRLRREKHGARWAAEEAARKREEREGWERFDAERRALRDADAARKAATAGEARAAEDASSEAPPGDDVPSSSSTSAPCHRHDPDDHRNYRDKGPPGAIRSPRAEVTARAAPPPPPRAGPSLRALG